MKFKVAGLGEVLWDIYAGSKTFGGAPANFACHCSMLGAEGLVSTVGAGDSYTATAIIGYLKGLELENINMHANKVASFVCSQRDAVPRLPTKLRQEVG